MITTQIQYISSKGYTERFCPQFDYLIDEKKKFS